MQLNFTSKVFTSRNVALHSFSCPAFLFRHWATYRGGGYSVQKTLQGYAANMGSKISLLVYEWPLMKCKIWYMNGWIFQYSQIWTKISSNSRKFWKNRVICSKFGQLVYEWWVTFSWKIGICMGVLSNSAAAHPYQNQTWVLLPPPPPRLHTSFSICGTWYSTLKSHNRLYLASRTPKEQISLGNYRKNLKAGLYLQTFPSFQLRFNNVNLMKRFGHVMYITSI